MTGKAKETDPVLVLYDGGCPMCRREIAHYRRLPGSDAVEWCDIATLPEGHIVDGITTADAMARFHVRGVDGRWSTGASAFIVLWQQLPRYRALAWTVTKLRLERPLDAAYRRFAHWRQARRCNSACTPPGAVDEPTRPADARRQAINESRG
jgi:predicted DCC family thiol-disulfide oxidoreductase YuxK